MTFSLTIETVKGRQLSLVAEAKDALQFRDFEEQSYTRGFQFIAGIDEAGRGPLAGPVVAAAVILPRGFTHAEIKDSKLLSALQREKLAPVIRQESLCWGIGVGEVDEIDRINILQASLLAIPVSYGKILRRQIALSKNHHQGRSIVYLHRRSIDSR